MGCDIHLFAEKLIKPKWYEFWKSRKWLSIDNYTPNPDFGKYEGESEFIIERENRIYTHGRNYNLFCALAGVRSFKFNDSPTSVSEPKGLPVDCCREIKDESERYGSDGHSHSWLTLAELNSFDWSPYGKTCDSFKQEVLPKLAQATDNPQHVRIVFFFDN